MLKRWIVVIAFTPAGCSPRPVDVAGAAGGVQPFSALQGVHLGMTARELAQTRADARPEGYTGYVESVGGYSIGYRIPGSYSEDQQVSPRARVSSVSASRAMGGVDHGLDEWRGIVSTAGTALQTRPACSRLASDSGVIGLTAEWHHDGTIFTATLFESTIPLSRDYTVTLGLMVDREPPPAGARSPVDCEGDLRGIFRSPKA